MKLATWKLADDMATGFITSMGNFKLCVMAGPPPALNGEITPALADALATGFITSMGNFKLHLFSGTMPATSAALAGSLTGYTRLVTYQAITAESGKYPIHWDSVATGTGIAQRLLSQTIEGVAAATGTATWGVLANVDDTLGSNASAVRYAFTVGVSGADVNLSTVSFVSGAVDRPSEPWQVPILGLNSALSAALATPILTYKDADGVTGLSWDSVSANTGKAKRLLSQSAQGVAASSADQTYAVLCPVGDTLGASSSAKRVLLTLGVNTGSGVQINNAALVAGVTYPFPQALEIGPLLKNTA